MIFIFIEDIIEIINTKKGKIDLEFWSKIIMETKIKEKNIRKCIFDFSIVENIYINGWILDFYDKYEIKIKDISELISEIVEVPIKITDSFDNNRVKKAIIYAGIRDIKQDPNNYEVEPIVNYEFTFDENQKEIENKEEEIDNKEKKKDLNDSEDDIGFGDIFS